MENLNNRSITIHNASNNDVTIRIQGEIGIPEWWAAWFGETVENTTKEALRKELEQITSIKSKRITVEIDSFGGDVYHALAMYDALRSTGAEITTKYIAWSASAATIIGMAGSKRIASENIYLLPHQVRGGMYGTAETQKNFAAWMEDLNNRLADIYSQVGGVEKSKIVELMAIENGEGRWLNAQDAMEYGLITEISKSYQAAASTRNRLLENKLPLNGLKFENMEDTSLKDKILGIVGFKNDEALKAENETLTGRITELERSKTELDNKVTELSGTISSLTESNTELQNQLTEKDAIISASQTKEAELQSEIEALKSELEIAKAQGIKIESSADPIGDTSKTSVEKDLEALRKKAGKK